MNKFESKLRDVEYRIKKLEKTVEKLYEKAEAHYQDIGVIIKVLKKHFPQDRI